MEDTVSKSRWLPLIFLLALLLRLGYIYQIEPLPFSKALIMDAYSEDSWGQEISSGDWLGREKGVFYTDPLYAYLLGGIYSIFGHDLMAVRVAQAVIDSVTCILIFFLGRMIFTPAVGLLSSLLASAYGPFIYYQGFIMKSTLTLFLLAVFLLTVLKAMMEHRKKMWFLSGFSLGLVAMTRGNILAFAPFVVIYILFSPEKGSLNPPLKRGNLKILLSRGIPVSIFLAGLTSALLPLATRNYIYGNAFVLTAPSIGMNFYIGNNPSALGIHTPIDSVRTIPGKEAEDAARIASLATGKALAPSEVSAFWLDKGIEFAVREPGRFLILLGRKVLLFWNHYEVPDVYNYSFFREIVPMLNLFLTFGIIAPLGIAGMLLSFKEFKNGRVVSGFIIIYMASLILFYITSRYRLPAALMLLPFTSYTLIFLTNSIMTQAYKKLIITVALLVPAILVANLNMLDERKLLSQSHSSIGNLYQQRGDLKEAITEYQASLKLDPRNWDTANNLAYLYARNGINLDEAMNLVKGALARTPNSPEMLDTLSLVYLKTGRVAEARESILKAIARDPRNGELSERLREIEQKMQP